MAVPPCEWAVKLSERASGGCDCPSTITVMVLSPYHYGISLCTWHLHEYLKVQGMTLSDLIPDPDTWDPLDHER